MRCCINRALAAGEILTAAEVTGIVGDDQYTALEMELEIREADASEWFLGLTEQAPWGAYLLLYTGLRPREGASSIYCLHHQLCNFTMYLWAPSVWIVSLIDKGMHADLADRWILGGFSQWHPRMLAGLEVLMLLGIAIRAYPLHVINARASASVSPKCLQVTRPSPNSQFCQIVVGAPKLCSDYKRKLDRDAKLAFFVAFGSIALWLFLNSEFF